MSKAFSTPPANASKHLSPFTVHVPEQDLADFTALLKLSKIAPATYESSQEDFKYGLTTKWLTEAKDYWVNKFDWRQSETKINALPAYTIPLTSASLTLSIHFTALFSQRPDAIPILFLHGWPGSFLEFQPLMTLLAAKYTPETLPYHIIVPSLPGYAFSAAPPLDANFQVHDVARFMDLLMRELGFGETGYVAQGGDIGSEVARLLGANHDACKAVHLNFSIMPEPPNVDKSRITAAEATGLERASAFKTTGSAYAAEHATRPATIGLALSASPLALLPWIAEKFLAWSDPRAPVPLAVILESVSLYYLTHTFPRAIYPYRQLFEPKSPAKAYIDKTFGFSWFPWELAPMPQAWVETTGRLTWWQSHERGGHFAALELPEVLWADVEAFVGEVWGKESKELKL